MRRSTRDFIVNHRGEEYINKTGTLTFINTHSGEIIPSDIAEELDRLGKFNKRFDNYKFIFKIV